MSIKEKYSKFISGKYEYVKCSNQDIEFIPSINGQETLPEHKEIELLDKAKFIKGTRVYGLVKETKEGLYVQWDEKINDFNYEKENIKMNDLPFDINKGDVLSVVITSADTKKASENTEFILNYTNHTQKESAKLNRKNLPKNKAILFASLIFRSSSHSKAYYGSHIVAFPVIVLGLTAVFMLMGPLLDEGDSNFFVNAYDNLTSIILGGAETTEQKVTGYSHIALFLALPFVCLWAFFNSYKEIKGIRELVKILDLL
jgi:hypothetical protein